MAIVTRTLAQLGGDLRIGDGAAAPTGPAAVVLERIAATARVLVEDYAPDAPEAVLNESFVRLAGWLYDADPSGSTPGGPAALRSSGAASLLGPYRTRRGGLITASPTDASGLAGAGLGTAEVLALIAQAGVGTFYKGPWSGLNAAGRAGLQIGDSVLHSGRFWRAHLIATARVTEPGAASASQSDGWHAQPPTYRGIAPAAERHFDPLDVATDAAGLHFLCLIEGAYNVSEVIAGPNWAAVGGGGVALATVEGLINADRASINTEIAQQISGVNTSLSNALSGFIAGHTPTSGLPAVIDPRILEWARAGNSDQIPADKLANAPAGAGGGLTQAQVDVRIAALVSDWAEVANAATPIPIGQYRPITVAAALPAPNQAIGSQLYGTGDSHADRVYWPKRIADQKTISLRTAFLTDARGDLAVVGWQADPELGRVTPPWGAALGITRLAIEPSGAGWRISMSGAAGFAHPTGVILSGVGTQTITLFRRAGSGNAAPIYDSADSSAARLIVAGATYNLKIRYSGGQLFINVHDADYLEGLASVDDTHALQAKIDRLESMVTSLAAAPAGGGPTFVGGFSLATPAHHATDIFDVRTYDNLMVYVNADVTRSGSNWDAHFSSILRKSRLPLIDFDAFKEATDPASGPALFVSLESNGYLTFALSPTSDVTAWRADVWGF